jgi:hypothetical protein
MRQERRAEEPKNGAREATGAGERSPKPGDGTTTVPAARGPAEKAVEPLVTVGSRPHDPAPRDFRQKAMYEDLMERALTPENVQQAVGAVIRNQGAPGIDGMTTQQLVNMERPTAIRR